MFGTLSSICEFHIAAFVLDIALPVENPLEETTDLRRCGGLASSYERNDFMMVLSSTSLTQIADRE
jgi:hypothetical protein